MIGARYDRTYRAREEQAPLQHNHKHIEKADQVARRILHRVIPEGVDSRPGEEIWVRFPGEMDDPL